MDIWALPTTDAILFLYEIKAADAGASWITKIRKNNLATEWQTPIPGFNLGEPLIDENHIYVSGIGFVGKVDLVKGNYTWRQDGLYTKYKANGFRRPHIMKDKVVFPIWNWSPNKFDKIILDRASGKILEP